MAVKRALRSREKAVHIQEIPNRFFPRASKAKKYQRELLRMMSNLRYTNERVQYSAQICAFNIDAINKKRGFVPTRSEVFRQIAGFVYHYENYCFRAYSFREKLLQFINATFSLNFSEKEVRLRFIKISPPVIAAKLVKTLERFENKKNFGKVIEDRNSMTHKLYYGETFNHYLQPISPVGPANEKDFKKWCKDWKKEILSRAELTNQCTRGVFEINHELAAKVIRYKEMQRKKPRLALKRLSKGR